MSDEYNGWANRETWAFNLHWQNDQGFYGWVLDMARTYLEDRPEAGDLSIGEYIVSQVTEELAELSPDLWELLREDVGSFWRIDYAEVGKAVREGLEDES